MAKSAPDPTQLLHAACLAAIERAAAGGPDPSRFASVGESLFWLVALAEAKGKHKTPGLILGLRWARNRIAHGVLMVEPAQYLRPFTMGLSHVGGPDVLGGGYLWRGRAALVFSRQQQPDPDGEVAYDTELAGRDVLGSLHAGLAEAMGQQTV